MFFLFISGWQRRLNGKAWRSLLHSPLGSTAQERGEMRGHTDPAGGRNGRVPTAETHIQESSVQVRRTMGQARTED